MPNGFAYDVAMDVFYDEFTTSDTNTKTLKSVHWEMLTNMPVTGSASEISQVPRTAFLQFLGSALVADKNILRRIKYLEFTWYGGNQVLVDYISVNQPSIGIVQKSAEYTNIQGGYGIFGSRCVQKIKNVTMDKNSIFLLRKSAETVNLNFQF